MLYHYINVSIKCANECYLKKLNALKVALDCNSAIFLPASKVIALWMGLLGHIDRLDGKTSQQREIKGFSVLSQSFMEFN